MQSPDRRSPLRRNDRLALLSLFLATSIILALLEIYIPRPLPWVKPGLANVVTLVVLYLYGFADALWLNILRVVVVNLITGGFGGPGFWLGSAAAVSATCFMYFALLFGAPNLGPIGVSLIGAFSHIFTQLLLAGLMIVGRLEILFLLPFFVVPAFFAGIVVGVLAYLLLQRLMQRMSLRFPLPALKNS